MLTSNFNRKVISQAGTLAGNLSIKHQHLEFPSDLFVLLESVGAKLAIASSDKEEDIIEVSPADYLYQDMSKKLILNISLPYLDPNSYLYRSYKVPTQPSPIIWLSIKNNKIKICL